MVVGGWVGGWGSWGVCLRGRGRGGMMGPQWRHEGRRGRGAMRIGVVGLSVVMETCVVGGGVGVTLFIQPSGRLLPTPPAAAAAAGVRVCVKTGGMRVAEKPMRQLVCVSIGRLPVGIQT